MQKLDIGAHLEQLDPEFAQAYREAFEEAADDCLNRPTVEKPRTLTLKLEVTPAHDPNTGVADGVKVRASLPQVKKPPMVRGRSYELLMRDGELGFNALNPFDARQGMLFEDQAEADAQKEESS